LTALILHDSVLDAPGRDRCEVAGSVRRPVLGVDVDAVAQAEHVEVGDQFRVAAPPRLAMVEWNVNVWPSLVETDVRSSETETARAAAAAGRVQTSRTAAEARRRRIIPTLLP
jgi:hypothetical protein